MFAIIAAHSRASVGACIVWVLLSCANLGCKTKEKQIEPPCTPVCVGRECGTDGCGGQCGTCDAPKYCLSNAFCAFPTTPGADPCLSAQNENACFAAGCEMCTTDGSCQKPSVIGDNCHPVPGVPSPNPDAGVPSPICATTTDCLNYRDYYRYRNDPGGVPGAMDICGMDAETGEPAFEMPCANHFTCADHACVDPNTVTCPTTALTVTLDASATNVLVNDLYSIPVRVDFEMLDGSWQSYAVALTRDTPTMTVSKTVPTCTGAMYGAFAVSFAYRNQNEEGQCYGHAGTRFSKNDNAVTVTFSPGSCPLPAFANH